MKRSAWLVKSEPNTYSFSKLLADGSTVWDGIRSFEARNNLRAMKKGDVLLFYHSNVGKEIVGLARVKREAFQDPTTTEDWSVIEIEALKPLKKPVALAQIKTHAKLKGMALVKKSRLSVSPVTPDELTAVLAHAETKL